MNETEQDKLVDYLKEFVTEKRLARFKNVIENRTRHLSVVLEDIYQTHNISAVLRSCECFGVQDVHIIENKYTFDINPDIELGASKWLTIKNYSEHDNNTATCLKSLKSAGYKIIATMPGKDHCNLEELDISEKTALVFGTELTGLTDNVKNIADGFMKIPMYGFTESFNISVTVALSIHYLTNKLRKSNINWQLSEKEKKAVLLDWLKNSIKNPEMIIKRFYESNK